MDGEELVTVLEEAGLSPYQADAYVTLLELGSASATDVADASDVPDPRIYDVLRNLESKGFVEIYEQEHLHARARPPTAVTSDLQSRADRFERAASEIEERWTRPPVERSKVSIVSRLETIVDEVAAAVRTAENQVQLCTTPDRFRTLRPALAAAVDNGVHVKLTLSAPDRNAVESIGLEGACTEARYRELPAPFVAIADRTRAYFVPHRDSINRYGVLVDDRSHAYVFHWFFLTTLWDVWDVLYRDDEESPRVYVNIRYCIRDIAPHVEAGDPVAVRVMGTDTETGDRRTIEGTVVDVTTTNELGSVNDARRGTLSVAEFAGVASIAVDTGDDVVTVGGWGATLERMEAERITVTDPGGQP
ncbi:TrmB family transcriptional regulator [Salinilacihabitans rarus]|uniref:TrmB family transcriptional regulator n=1 Tax=Salinilacihabitans rarus TaxID=2961596 RepID=UPI0020C8BC34|nr:TrmB family transcriptional regulator [Salinilacihabitans rarus]